MNSKYPFRFTLPNVSKTRITTAGQAERDLHKSYKVKEFVAKHKKRLELLYLPSYSPDLNPIERVWKHLRYHVTHNVYFETLQLLENAIISYLKEHAKPNESLKSLCCIN